ncbi:MAG: VOC family protein [bacterium]
MATIRGIRPCLWFDSEAEQAAKFYTGIFSNSRIIATTHYGEAGMATHRRPPGSVMTVVFELDGHEFTALNGGPVFRLTEAVSFEVRCETQDDIDHYWKKLTAGGDDRAQQCGWLKDKFGLSWQIVSENMAELLGDSDPEAAGRTMETMLHMKKIDIAALERAHAGETAGVHA